MTRPKDCKQNIKPQNGEGSDEVSFDSFIRDLEAEREAHWTYPPILLLSQRSWKQQGRER